MTVTAAVACPSAGSRRELTEWIRSLQAVELRLVCAWGANDLRGEVDQAPATWPRTNHTARLDLASMMLEAHELDQQAYYLDANSACGRRVAPIIFGINWITCVLECCLERRGMARFLGRVDNSWADGWLEDLYVLVNAVRESPARGDLLVSLAGSWSGSVADLVASVDRLGD